MSNSRKVIVKFNREEALACIIALEKEKPYQWQEQAIVKLDKARKTKPISDRKV